MNKFIFIVGGARSGKSSYAVNLAKKTGKNVTFIATASGRDKEMKQRIRLHKKSRPAGWRIIEEEVNLTKAMSEIKAGNGLILVDCLGLWISNLLSEGLSQADISSRIKKLIKVVVGTKSYIIVVSNEVGSGIVPKNALARKFRDLMGFTNQSMAKHADRVIVMQAGIPIAIKGA